MDYQRDAFIDEIYHRSKTDERIMLLSADFGAPALDRYREERASQFLHMGISEQNMIDVAAGLALDGWSVFVYAMAPFVSLRCLEQHKCNGGLMDLPICTLVSGIGLGYADAGPTHYISEDFACLRAIVNSNVYTCADASTAGAIAKQLCDKPQFSFVRLDRHPSKDIGNGCSDADVTKGFRILSNASADNVCVISTGYMSHRVSEALSTLGDEITHIDLIRAKPMPMELRDILGTASHIVTVDEQTPQGGLGGAVLEFMADTGIVKPMKRMCLPEQYFFNNGGRHKLLDDAGLSVKAIAETVSQLV